MKQVGDTEFRWLAEYEMYGTVNMGDRFDQARYESEESFVNKFRRFKSSLEDHLKGTSGAFFVILDKFNQRKKQLSNILIREVTKDILDKADPGEMSIIIQNYGQVESKIFNDHLTSVTHEYNISLYNDMKSMRALVSSEVTDEIMWIYGLPLSITVPPKQDDRERISLIFEAVKRIYKQRSYLTPKLLREVTGFRGAILTPEKFISKMEGLLNA